jgi:phosphate transport system substrate-binding protein
MRAAIAKSAIVLLLAGAVPTGTVAAADTLRVGGTGGAIEMMRHVAPVFGPATGINMEVIPGLGSGGALRALRAGVLDIAVAARKLEPVDASRGFVAVPVARTALVFVTSHPKPNSLKSSELPEIFKSATPKWADGSPINILLRTKLDGDTLILQEYFTGMQAAIEAARLRPDVPIAATDQDSADVAERLLGSFVQAGLSQIITEKRDLRFVPIDGVEPSLANLESGKYPYEKIFYFVFPAKRSVAAERLLEFMRSAQGQNILRATGNLPIIE